VYAACVLKARLRRMNGYGSQCVSATAFTEIQVSTTALCARRHWGVPKARANAAALRPNASEPNGDDRCACRSWNRM